MFEKVFYDDSKLTQEEILAMDFSHIKDMYVKVIVINKENPYWFDLFIEKINKAEVIDFKVVEDHVILVICQMKKWLQMQRTHLLY